MSKDGGGGVSANGNAGSNSNSVTFEFSDPPQCWEYATHVIPQAMMQQALEDLGRDGWELSQAFPCAVQTTMNRTGIITPPGVDGQGGMPSRESGLMMIFKRPKRVLRDDVGKLCGDVGVN